MIQMFCDVCGEKLTRSENRVSRRIIRSAGKVKVEIIVGVVGGAWNSGELCKKCVLAVVASGTDS